MISQHTNINKFRNKIIYFFVNYRQVAGVYQDNIYLFGLPAWKKKRLTTLKHAMS